jgi:hypothetical protein
MKKMSAVALCALSLSGCASMFGGTSQEIEITTSPPGANCAIERAGKIVGRVNPTPGTVMIGKSRQDIRILCEKPEYDNAVIDKDSGVEPWVFANLFFGGLIGLGIDHATGAVNEYDSPVHVPLAQTLAKTVAPVPTPPVDEAPPASAAEAPAPTS